MKPVYCFPFAMAIFPLGCAMSAESNEHVDEVAEAQFDPGCFSWREATLTFSNSGKTPFATMYLFNQDIGSFKRGFEYWFLNTDSLALVGKTPVDVAITDETTLNPPPATTYAHEQTFVTPVSQAGAWGKAWSSDPVSGGALYQQPTGLAFRLNLSSSTPETVLAITWYQVVPSSQLPANIDPIGRFDVIGTKVEVPSGYAGYDIRLATP